MVEQRVFTDTWPNHTDDSLLPPFLPGHFSSPSSTFSNPLCAFRIPFLKTPPRDKCISFSAVSIFATGTGARPWATIRGTLLCPYFLLPACNDAPYKSGHTAEMDFELLDYYRPWKIT